MFPNVRLLIGALFITVVVLSCEFGVFAALRVNREPLSRLTSESAPLQLVAGKTAPPAMPISWSAPRNALAPAGDTQSGIATGEAPVAHPGERAIEASAPANAAATDTRDGDNQTAGARLQTALAPSPAAPVPAAAPAGDAAAPIAHAPNPPAANAPASENAATLTNPDANGAPAQEVPAAAVIATVDNNPPEQTAGSAAPVQQTPAVEIAKPAEAEPPQAAAAAQAHETAAPASEPPPGGAAMIAAIAPAAPEPAAAPAAEFTGSLPNPAMPARAAPKGAAPHAHPKPSRKIVHKPAAQKPHKIAREPAPPYHPVKKRVARARPAAAAATAQPANDFNNPVFQSAPAYQRPTRSRPGTKNTATNSGYSNSFGAPFGTQ